MPVEEAKTAITAACKNVTDKLANLPKELLANSTKEVNVSLSGVCAAIVSLKTNHAAASIQQLHIATAEPVNEPSTQVVAHVRFKQRPPERFPFFRLQQLSQHSVLHVQTLLEESTIQSAVTGALSKAVEIFKEAAAKAVLKVIPIFSKAINKTLTSLKDELQAQADDAAAFASKGLETLKTEIGRAS